MPIPQPQKGEKHEDFHHRCMSDTTMMHDYADMKQRNAICFRTWERKDASGMALPLLAFSHNSTEADSEPSWGSVDKSKLPRAAFADQGDAGKKSTWGYPHHWVSGGGGEDENGVYTTGTMYLHRGGLNAAWSAAHGGRSGQTASAAVIAHLDRHRQALGLDKDAGGPETGAALDHPDCFRAHLGLWAIEPLWFTAAIRAIQARLWPERTAEELQQMRAAMRSENTLFAKADSTAIIRIVGQMSKGMSKFNDGTSSIAARRAIRQALADEDIKSILLAIDSPGGQVAGTQELADAVKAASYSKPVAAYIEDLGASAAYWVASQAQRITSNRTAEIGSIGVLAALEDTSGMADRAGLKVHVVSTGPYKGMGMHGTSVLPEHLAEVQERVDSLAQHFFASVQSGRRLTQSQMGPVTDGRVFSAQRAVELGLSDGVGTFEDALAGLRQMRARRRANIHALQQAGDALLAAND